MDQDFSPPKTQFGEQIVVFFARNDKAQAYTGFVSQQTRDTLVADVLVENRTRHLVSLRHWDDPMLTIWEASHVSEYGCWMQLDEYRKLKENIAAVEEAKKAARAAAKAEADKAQQQAQEPVPQKPNKKQLVEA